MYLFRIERLTYQGLTPLHPLEVVLRADSSVRDIAHPSLKILCTKRGIAETLCFPAQRITPDNEQRPVTVTFVYRDECIHVLIGGSIETSVGSKDWRIKNFFALNSAVGCDLDHQIRFIPALLADPC